MSWFKKKEGLGTPEGNEEELVSLVGRCALLAPRVLSGFLVMGGETSTSTLNGTCLACLQRLLRAATFHQTSWVEVNSNPLSSSGICFESCWI